MSKCIKCGAEIPDGELFCQECSLNAGSTMFEETRAPRYKAPPGHMQTPQPVAHTRVESAPTAKRKKHAGRGAKIALALVSLLLLGALAFMGTQYGKLQVAKTRLRTKEADIALRLADMEKLEQELTDVNAKLAEANQTISDKEAEIVDLMNRLADSQSSENQGEYDLTQTEKELERLHDENQQLLALTDELKLKQTQLQSDYHALEAEALELGEKADFLDTYVVFVQNDGSGYYHSYDCKNFTKKDFWAYSRSLAEFEGYEPCPVCGGKP